MNKVLDSAHTWFLESYQQGPYGSLVIRLAEGIKGTERLPVQIGDQTLGLYFPVAVERASRCATIVFDDVRAVLTYAEGYDAEDPKLEMEEGRFLRCVTASSFRDFAGSSLSAIDDFRGEFSEWLVWTEELILQVLSGAPPEVRLEDRQPDDTIERGKTWSAT